VADAVIAATCCSWIASELCLAAGRELVLAVNYRRSRRG
jgi:hypothetical protein